MSQHRAVYHIIYRGVDVKPIQVKSWDRWRAMVKFILREYPELRK